MTFSEKNLTNFVKSCRKPVTKKKTDVILEDVIQYVEVAGSERKGHYLSEKRERARIIHYVLLLIPIHIAMAG